MLVRSLELVVLFYTAARAIVLKVRYILQYLVRSTADLAKSHQHENQTMEFFRGSRVNIGGGGLTRKTNWSISQNATTTVSCAVAGETGRAGAAQMSPSGIDAGYT